MSTKVVINDFSIMLFSHQIMSDSLQPHGLQHARLLCPPLSPGVCSDSCPLNQWCHPTISSSVTPFFSCPQSFPASVSFPMSWFLESGGQSEWFFLIHGQIICLQCRRHRKCRSDPWVGIVHWRRKWQPTSIFLPGESHVQRSLVGYSPKSHKESDMTE